MLKKIIAVVMAVILTMATTALHIFAIDYDKTSLLIVREIGRNVFQSYKMLLDAGIFTDDEKEMVDEIVKLKVEDIISFPDIESSPFNITVDGNNISASLRSGYSFDNSAIELVVRAMIPVINEFGAVTNFLLAGDKVSIKYDKYKAMIDKCYESAVSTVHDSSSGGEHGGGGRSFGTDSDGNRTIIENKGNYINIGGYNFAIKNLGRLYESDLRKIVTKNPNVKRGNECYRLVPFFMFNNELYIMSYREHFYNDSSGSGYELGLVFQISWSSEITIMTTMSMLGNLVMFENNKDDFLYTIYEEKYHENLKTNTYISLFTNYNKAINTRISPNCIRIPDNKLFDMMELTGGVYPVISYIEVPEDLKTTIGYNFDELILKVVNDNIAPVTDEVSETFTLTKSETEQMIDDAIKNAKVTDNPVITIGDEGIETVDDVPIENIKNTDIDIDIEDNDINNNWIFSFIKAIFVPQANYFDNKVSGLKQSLDEKLPFIEDVKAMLSGLFNDISELDTDAQYFTINNAKGSVSDVLENNLYEDAISSIHSSSTGGDHGGGGRVFSVQSAEVYSSDFAVLEDDTKPSISVFNSSTTDGGHGGSGREFDTKEQSELFYENLAKQVGNIKFIDFSIFGKYIKIVHLIIIFVAYYKFFRRLVKKVPEVLGGIP